MLKVGDKVTVRASSHTKTPPHNGESGIIYSLGNHEDYPVGIKFKNGYTMNYKEIELMPQSELIQALLEVIQ